jgi:uncharacterized membrane protein YbhN (UPF0104 family)
LPAGVYVQNFLLARLEHFDQATVARTTMASTAMLGLEAALAVPVALVIGWPGGAWVRWLLLGIVAAWCVGVGGAWILIRRGTDRLPARTPGWARRVATFIKELLEAGRDLFAWRTARLLAPTALYMLVYVYDLYVILRALGIDDVDFVSTTGIYAFVVLAVILVPIPTEIGLTELTSLVALTARGIPEPVAAIATLALRALGTGMTIVVAVGTLLLLWNQVKRPMPDTERCAEAGVASSLARAEGADTRSP